MSHGARASIMPKQDEMDIYKAICKIMIIVVCEFSNNQRKVVEVAYDTMDPIQYTHTRSSKW